MLAVAPVDESSETMHLGTIGWGEWCVLTVETGDRLVDRLIFHVVLRFRLPKKEQASENEQPVSDIRR